MKIRRIQEAELENKKVLLRVDFNVALENEKVKEDFKIKVAQETINYLLSRGAKVALLSHLGRPEGMVKSEFSLAQIKDDVQKILGKKINFISDCIGEKINKISREEILLLENVRFHLGDKNNNQEFSQKLAENFDIFINDAFSVSHRDQASVTGVAKILPSYAGFRLQKEIAEMEKIKNNFERPAIAIIGGAKIKTKLPVINFFETNYDFILVGGKIANEALDEKIKFSEKVILPLDFIDNRLDIGNKTLAQFKALIVSAKTIVWNGPTGKFEEKKYAKSSNEILEAILASGAYTVIGGGETIEIVEKNKAMNKISFVSTGGGAMLAYLGGEKMPGIEVLENRK